MLGSRADQPLRVGDELLDPRADRTGLLLEIPAHRAYLTLESAAILADAALDAGAPLAELTLEPSAGPADLTLEAVASGDAAALVASQLAPDVSSGAVIRDEAPHGRDEVVPREEARADGNEDHALGEDLRLLDPGLGLRRSGGGPGGA